MRTGITEDGEIAANPLELGGRHPDGGGVLSVGDAENVGLDLEQLQVELGHFVLLCRDEKNWPNESPFLSRRQVRWRGGKGTLALKSEGDHAAGVLGPEGDGIVVTGALEDLGHGAQVDAELEAAVAAVVLEALGVEHEGDQRDVARVHGLEGDALGRAVEVGIGDEVLHGLEDLLEQTGLVELGFKHLGVEVRVCR